MKINWIFFFSRSSKQVSAYLLKSTANEEKGEETRSWPDPLELDQWITCFLSWVLVLVLAFSSSLSLFFFLSGMMISDESRFTRISCWIDRLCCHKRQDKKSRVFPNDGYCGQKLHHENWEDTKKIWRVMMKSLIEVTSCSAEGSHSLQILLHEGIFNAFVFQDAFLFGISFLVIIISLLVF